MEGSGARGRARDGSSASASRSPSPRGRRSRHASPSASDSGSSRSRSPVERRRTDDKRRESGGHHRDSRRRSPSSRSRSRSRRRGSHRRRSRSSSYSARRDRSASTRSRDSYRRRRSSPRRERSPPRHKAASRERRDSKRDDGRRGSGGAGKRTPPRVRSPPTDRKPAAPANDAARAPPPADGLDSIAALRAARGGGAGAYVPPHRKTEAAVSTDPSTPAFQKAAWEALRKSINGLINKVNTGNLTTIVFQLFQVNLIRGRGLLCRSLLAAQAASPTWTPVYAALVAVINTKLPEIGDLLLRRIVVRFRTAFRRNNKAAAMPLTRFIAHLVNQGVAHELLALQVLMLLLERPSDDAVEVAVGFTKECGALLSDVSPAGLNAVFDRFRAIIAEGEVSDRVRVLVEALFTVRKAKFAGHPAVPSELDLVEEEDKITHETALDDEGLDTEDKLDVWAHDPEYTANEAAWADIKREIVGDDEDGGGAGSAEGEGAQAVGAGEGGDEGDADHDGALVVADDGGAAAAGGAAASAVALPSSSSVPDAVAAAPPRRPGEVLVQDLSETDLVNLRRTIYLTIMNSLDFEECAHKFTKMRIPRGAEPELCNMLIECCSQEKTFMRYYGLLGARFAMVSAVYQDAFEQAFKVQYESIHRLETNKLRNVAKFFAHMLQTDALPWTVFQHIHLNEEETSSASRIFIKVLIQEIVEHLGLLEVRSRFADASMQRYYGGIFPTDVPRHTRFSINFFTSIGLGALTDAMRVHLQAAAAAAAAAPPPAPAAPPALPASAPARGRSGSRSSRSSYSSRSYSSGSSRTYSSYYTYSGSSRTYSSYYTYSGSSRSRSTASSRSGSSYSRSRSPPRRKAAASSSRSRSSSYSRSVSRSSPRQCRGRSASRSTASSRSRSSGSSRSRSSRSRSRSSYSRASRSSYSGRSRSRSPTPKRVAAPPAAAAPAPPAPPPAPAPAPVPAPAPAPRPARDEEEDLMRDERRGGAPPQRGRSPSRSARSPEGRSWGGEDLDARREGGGGPAYGDRGSGAGPSAARHGRRSPSRSRSGGGNNGRWGRRSRSRSRSYDQRRRVPSPRGGERPGYYDRRPPPPGYRDDYDRRGPDRRDERDGWGGGRGGGWGGRDAGRGRGGGGPSGRGGGPPHGYNGRGGPEPPRRGAMPVPHWMQQGQGGGGGR